MTGIPSVISLATIPAEVSSFRIDGVGTYAGLGRSVASAGDVNGDGYADLIVGAVSSSQSGRSYAGSAYVVFGKASGFTNLDVANLPAGAGFRIDGAAASDGLGYSVASAGDVNGDGYADLIVGADYASANGRANAGVSYVVYGHAGGFGNLDLANLTATQGYRIVGAAAGDKSGSSVSSAGDLNHDGYADLIVGAPQAGPSGRTWAGSSYVVFGHAGTSGTVDLANLGSTGFRVDGAAAYDLSGQSVASAGDLNGDGYADLIVGSPDGTGSGRYLSGTATVVFGQAGGFTNLDLTNLSTAAGFRISGATSADYSGHSVASAGDVNGDGYADLVIGGYGADPSGRSMAGGAWVVFGHAGSFGPVDLANLGSAGFQISGAAAGDYAGYSVASAGDVNGDGYADILVGAEQADPGGRNNAGSTYVVFGHAGSFGSVDLANLGNAGFRVDGATAGDFSGDAVASAGDLNRDGYADLVIGASDADPSGRMSAGSSYVIFGQASAAPALSGSAAADTLVGGRGNDRIEGLGGNDRLEGLGGDDTLVGGDGNDTLAGGAGNNLYDGGAGFDVAELAGIARRASDFGASGSDILVTHIGATDTLRGIERVDLADGQVQFDAGSAVAQVTRLYDSAFGRTPDQAGLHAWATALKTGTALATVASGFAGSAEYAARYPGADNATFVEQLYLNTLHRGSDPAGKAAWVGALDGGTQTRAQVLVGFSESAEHQANTAPAVQAGLWDLSENAAFVARLYDTTLGRLPDIAGLSAWRTLLDAGSQTHQSVVQGFTGSAEFQARYPNVGTPDFVELLYVNALHRASDPGGKATWVSAIDGGSITRADAVLGFSESAEHQALTHDAVLSDTPAQFGILFA